MRRYVGPQIHVSVLPPSAQVTHSPPFVGELRQRERGAAQLDVDRLRAQLR